MTGQPGSAAYSASRRGRLALFGKDMKASAKIGLIVLPWALLLCLGIAHLWNGLHLFPWAWEEKGRVAAPSGQWEVVTYQGNRGAMSSFAYVCFVVKSGGKADPNDCDLYEPVLSSSHVQPTVRWDGSHRVIITIGDGYVTHERPYARDGDVTLEFQGGTTPPKIPGQ